MLGPDAGVEHADDHAFAGGTLPAEVLPDRLRADESGTPLGGGLVEPIAVDGGDPGERRDRIDGGRRDAERDAAQHHLVAVEQLRLGATARAVETNASCLAARWAR